MGGFKKFLNTIIDKYMETLVCDQFNRINHYHKSGQDFVGTIMHVNVKNNV